MARLLHPGQGLFIDAGSANLAFARVIPPGLNLTIATHDPGIAASLVGRPGVELIVVGGIIHPEVGAALAGRVMRQIGTMRPDLLILGACSLCAEQGIGAFHLKDAELKCVMIERAGSVAMAVLNEKLRSVSPHTVAPLNAIADVVVDEKDAPEEETRILTNKGIRVHRADAAFNESEREIKDKTRKTLQGEV